MLRKILSPKSLAAGIVWLIQCSNPVPPPAAPPPPDLALRPEQPVLVNEDISCIMPTATCGNLMKSPDGMAFVDPELKAVSGHSECVPAFSLRGCACLPVRTLWDYDGSSLIDNGDSFVIKAGDDLNLPIYAARVRKNGNNLRFMAWNIYLINVGVASPDGLTVSRKLSDLEIPFDKFKACK